MSDPSLIVQLAIILGFMCFVLTIALVNQVMKRKAMVRELVNMRDPLSVPPKRQHNEFQSIGSIPEWLVFKLNATRYDFVLDGVITWLDYARGNLLLATVGSIVAFLGALLAASGLLLFGVVGAGVMVVGFQIMYAAAQDAGVLGSVMTPATPEKKRGDKAARVLPNS
jgi:hypothetical protein